MRFVPASLFGTLALSLLVAVPSYAQSTEVARLAPESLHRSAGTSVAVEGERALVGAPGSTLVPSLVAVFEAVDGDWVEVAALTRADLGGTEAFGSAVSLAGDLAVVGAPDDVGGGSVTVFAHAGGAWAEEAVLSIPGGADGDDFGGTVSASGDRVVVGASGAGDGGAAFVFARSGGAWELEATLMPADLETGDLFGGSVALDGSRAVVGAMFDDDAGAASGAAYVFDLVGGVWTQTSKLTASDGAMLDFFGASVALSGDLALVGATGDDDGGSGAGAAYLFRLSGCGTTCTQEAKLLAADARDFDDFGWAVALTTEQALIGAPRDDRGGLDNAGSAYVFDLDGCGAVCTETTSLVASDAASADLLGFSVAMAGDVLLVGAPGVVGLSDDSAGYLFVLGPNTQPVADAGPDQRAVTGQTVALDGSASFDPDGDPLSYAWTADGVVLVGADTATPSFCAPAPPFFPVPLGVRPMLTVNDGTQSSTPDESLVLVYSVDGAQGQLQDETARLFSTGDLTRAQAGALLRFLRQVRVAIGRGLDPTPPVAAYQDALEALVDSGDLSADQVAPLVSLSQNLTEAVVSPCTASEDAPRVSRRATALDAPFTVSPNPFRGSARVSFHLDGATEVRLVVMDVLGRDVAVLADGPMAAGRHEATLDGTGLPTGSYVLRLTADDGHAVIRRVTLVR